MRDDFGNSGAACGSSPPAGGPVAPGVAEDIGVGEEGSRQASIPECRLCLSFSPSQNHRILPGMSWAVLMVYGGRLTRVSSVEAVDGEHGYCELGFFDWGI